MKQRNGISRGCMAALAFFFAALSAAGAQQIATVGVVDVGKIYAAFPQEAGGYADLEKLKQQYQKEIDEQVDKLELMKRERVLAMKNNDFAKADQLDAQIDRMAQYIDALSERRQQSLIQQSGSPASRAFLGRLQSAIEFVAEEKGYTLIFQSGAAGLQWWAPVVDVTERVIQRLREM